MLESGLGRPPVVLNSGDPVSPADEAGIGSILIFVRGFLQRQYGIIIIGLLLAVAAAFVYLHLTPPVYTAHVQILLANPKSQFVQQELIVAEPSFDRSGVDTQLAIINSPAIANIVIERLHLGPDLIAGSSDALEAWVRHFLGKLGKAGAERAPPKPDEIIAGFLKRLSATRVETTNIIDVSFSWDDPNRAAQIANAIADAYIKDQLNAKFDANKTAAFWLQQRIQELADQAETAERAVNAYKTQNNMVSSDGKGIDEQQVTQLNSRVVAARAQAADLQARLDRYDIILKDNPATEDSIGILDAAGSGLLSSPIITNLRQEYLELSRREKEYSARFGKNHLVVVNLRTRMQELRSSIFDEVRRIAESTRNDYNVAEQRARDLENQLAKAVAATRTIDSAQVTLSQLESKAKNYRSLYSTFLARYSGAAQQQSFPISEARVIYPAFPPDKKSKPKTLMILALAIFAGAGIGGGLGMVREMMERVFRTPHQVETALGLPCLSVVPLLQNEARETETNKGARRPGKDAEAQRAARILSINSGLHWSVVNTPLSQFAEAMRFIKLGIELRAAESPNKVIGITSALPHEGKSTISVSLAQLIAQSGKSVILVDCDLRNPSLSNKLTPAADRGLLEVISELRSVDDCVWKEPTTNLAFLPAVKRLPLLHSSEILMTEQMKKVFDHLRADYDYVVVDLPPLSPIVDVRATTALVDCFALVVEWAKTKIDVVQHALHTAPNVYENLAGVVLNKTDIKSMARYDSYISDYYREDNYTHYGVGGPG